jgi:hypothetical protein
LAQSGTAGRGWALHGASWRGKAIILEEKNMKIATVSLKSASGSPYSQSRHYTEDVPKKAKESAPDYEMRTWQSRMHVNKEGFVEIPGPCFANCLKSAAKRLKIQVPGKGRVEYTKYFEAGVMVTDSLTLPIKSDDVGCDKLFVPSDGKRGGGKRVIKYFPRIEEWAGQVQFYIFDDIITEEVFTQVLRAAGMLVGIGRFRPENCGFYGRFTVESLDWSEVGDEFFAA